MSPAPTALWDPLPFFFNFDRLGVRVPTIMVSPWINKGTVVHRPSGPSPSSEFEHSSIPATIKKMFNLSANFLTHRDAWAGTFEGVVSLRDSPRTDCPEVLPDVQHGTAKKLTSGDGELSEFQQEVVQLAAVLNGDHLLNSFPDKGMFGKSMKVKQAAQYVDKAMTGFMEASIHALDLGASDFAIVHMKPSLTSKKTNP